MKFYFVVFVLSLLQFREYIITYHDHFCEFLVKNCRKWRAEPTWRWSEASDLASEFGISIHPKPLASWRDRPTVHISFSSLHKSTWNFKICYRTGDIVAISTRCAYRICKSTDANHVLATGDVQENPRATRRNERSTKITSAPSLCFECPREIC